MIKTLGKIAVSGAILGVVGALALYFLKKAPVVGGFVSKLDA